jgi:biotin carboxyl carrier protein
LLTVSHTLTHADVDKIIKLVETLQRTRLHFVRIEAQGFEIQISRSDQVSGVSTVVVQNNRERRDYPNDVAVRSPNVGVFSSAVPHIARVLEVGDGVVAASILGSVQTLDERNSICAGLNGTVEAVFVKDGDFVEFGQRLFSISPSLPRIVC